CSRLCVSIALITCSAEAAEHGTRRMVFSHGGQSPPLLMGLSLIFWCLAAVVGISAIMVVVTQNIVRAAVWLLFTLVGTCGIYFLLGADFVGATQLIVYVGGTLVLVVFGVMLTAQGPFITMKAGSAEWAISLVVGFALFGILVAATTNATAPDPR